MNSRLLGIDRGEIDFRKALLFLVILEMVTMAVFLTGDIIIIGIFAAIVLTPVFLFLIPVEPVLTVPFLFIATGLHFFALITKREDTWYNLTYFHIAALVTLMSVFANFLLKRKKTIPSCSLWPPVIVLLSLMAFSLIYTPLFVDGFMDFSRLIILCIITFSMIMIIDSKWKVKFVMMSYVIIPICVSLATVYDILTGGEFYKSQVLKVATELGIHVYRSTGTFHNPNDLATFLMVGIIVSFGLLFIKKMNIFIRTFLIVCILISSAGLIATFSRGGWLSTFAGCFFLILIHRKWSYMGLFFGIFGLMFLIMSIKFPEIVLSAFGRFATIFDPSNEASSSSRISLMKTGISMWKDNPIFGVGSAGYSYYAIDYMDPNMPRGEVDVILPHTLQIKILAEEGLAGLTAATWFFFTVLFDGLRVIKTIKDDFLRNSQIILTSLFVAFIVCFTFNSDMHHNIFWITIGVMYANSLVSQKMQREENHLFNAD
ncbi:O-antigen ligase family protein [Candidatus Latescibacterota bacterium]